MNAPRPWLIWSAVALLASPARGRCGAGLAAACLFVALPTNAQNSVQWTTNYYTVTGATLAEIRQSLRQTAPPSAHGLTEWRLEWRFNTARTEAGCNVVGLSTKIIIRTTLPRWVAPTNATAATSNAWQRYRSALGQHELGHAQFAYAAAAQVRSQVTALGTVADCSNLQRLVNETAQRVVEEFREREKKYDQLTEHGATQGVVFPGRERRERRGGMP